MQHQLDKVGTIGLFITALASPCCFPLFGFALAAMGLGSFELFGGWTMWVFQALVLVSLAGTYISYRQHRCLYPLLIAVPGALMIFYSYHIIEADYWTYILYSGMICLLGAAVINYYRIRFHNKVILLTEITCPACGHTKRETMPENACQYFYVCESCNTRLKPKPGDCCVYCSYGTVQCPPIQKGEKCC